MSLIDTSQIEGAETVLACPDLDETLQFFTQQLAFRVASIFPADDPYTAIIEGYGQRLVLQRGASAGPVTLRLRCRAPQPFKELKAPNGTRIELVEASPLMVLPPLQPSFSVSKRSDESHWGKGRAGMFYRDLIPGRLGGRFIASHIMIQEGGPVPDYVHFHKLRLQLIYCYKGWVRVVYEEQGEPFLMQEGDCVLQPPEIRHRVLESSPGLEVIELSSPAHHETVADHQLSLPNSTTESNRDFGGQRFVRHQAATAAWEPWHQEGFEARDLGISAATNQLASVQVIRKCGPSLGQPQTHQGELLFIFVLTGSLTLHSRESPLRLLAGDCFVIPAGVPYAFTDDSNALSFLQVNVSSQGEISM
jgi:quercetin dioxygenase-like cupin family protein